MAKTNWRVLFILVIIFSLSSLFFVSCTRENPDLQKEEDFNSERVEGEFEEEISDGGDEEKSVSGLALPKEEGLLEWSFGEDLERQIANLDKPFLEITELDAFAYYWFPNRGETFRLFEQPYLLFDGPILDDSSVCVGIRHRMDCIPELIDDGDAILEEKVNAFGLKSNRDHKGHYFVKDYGDFELQIYADWDGGNPVEEDNIFVLHNSVADLEKTTGLHPDHYRYEELLNPVKVREDNKWAKYNYYFDAMYLPEDELLNRMQGGYEILEMRGETVSAYTELSTGARYSMLDGICTSVIAPASTVFSKEDMAMNVKEFRDKHADIIMDWGYYHAYCYFFGFDDDRTVLIPTDPEGYVLENGYLFFKER